MLAAAGGWYFYQNQGVPAENAHDSGWVLSASFMCEDGSTRFEALFPNANEIQITRDGVNIRMLPLVERPGQRFEDSEYVYVFAGEEVTVTTKATQKSVICSQPVDPNNAPVNFGDQGEGGGTKQDVIFIVSESIVGKWKSVDDATFVREFMGGGKVRDLYGKVVSTGTYTVFTKEKPAAVPFPLEANAIYIQLTMAGTQADTLNFKLSKTTLEELELIYMDRGGVLRFTHVQLGSLIHFLKTA